MSRELDKLRDALVTSDDEDRRNLPLPFSNHGHGGFLTFRYSSTEIFSQGGNLHVKMKETRYQDGRLKSEECEGTLDRQVYDRMVSDAQRYFLNQMTGFLRLLYAPFAARGRRWDE
ncbi:MAG: hypothetical protein ACREX0_15290 [Noviherbaspirillum sp.]